jgi:hypothetical protein
MKLSAITVWIDPHAAGQLALWENALNTTGISLTRTPTGQLDAALVSVGRCEKYGCRAGSTDDTLGRMEVFDSWNYEPPGNFPRFQISNAVWRSDPALLEAVVSRLNILERTIDNYNTSHAEAIQSLMITAGVLGFWSRHTEAEQREAIECVVARLKQWIA